MQYLLGIEVSRSNIGICLFEESGKLVSKSGYPIEISLNSASFGELNPEIWWEKTVQGIHKVVTESKIDSSDITVIGFSGFHECPVLTDEFGKPVRSVIFHPDKNFDSLILWIKENNPGIIEKARWVLTPKDYLRFQFTGQAHTDYSAASAMGFLDLNTQKWNLDKIQKLNLPPEKLPTLKASHHAVGVITPEAAESTGLAMGTLVGAGGGEIESGLFGLGIVNPGEMGVLIHEQFSFAIVSPKPVSTEGNPWTVTHHVIPGKWVVSVSLTNWDIKLKENYQNIRALLQKENISIAKRVIISNSNPLSPIQEKSISEVFGQSIELSKQKNGSAFGGALLAGVAGGVYLSLEECLKQCVEKFTTHL